MFEAYFRQRVREAADWLRAGVNSAMSAVSQVSWNFEMWVHDHEWAVLDTLESWRGWWVPWPLNYAWWWVVDRLKDLNGMLFHAIGEVPLVGRRWVNQQWSDSFGDWEANRHVWAAFSRLEMWAVTIGRHMDGWVKELYDRVWAVFDVALDPIGWAVGECERIIARRSWSLWDHFKAISPNYFEALKSMFALLGFTLLALLPSLQDILLWVIGPVLEPIGWGICECTRIITDSVHNYWDHWKAISPNNWEALITACRVLGGALHEWHYNLARMIQELRGELDALLRDPGDYILTKLEEVAVWQAERMWRMFERLLERVW